MADKHTVSSSSSENSNDSDTVTPADDTVTPDDSKTPAAETPAAETQQLSLQEIIARNRERALQIRAAKRSIPQEPAKLVQAGPNMGCCNGLDC